MIYPIFDSSETDVTSVTSSHDILAIDHVTFRAEAEAAEAPPIFTLQPSLQTVAVGDPASFFAEARGCPASAYQWSLDRVLVESATGTTLAIGSAQLADAGDYTLVATNALGSATSAGAVLTVEAPPVIAEPPAAAQAALWGLHNFSMQAVGAGPFAIAGERMGRNARGKPPPPCGCDRSATNGEATTPSR